ncbi:MAG: DUF1841 family protein [Thermoguttaceae bacterium]|jgi:hypothetical protein|nr:DUF1841 family protein [Thermoguttaceae bacterium]
MPEDKRELTEDAAMEIALQDHPEWRRALDKDKLPDEIIGDDGQPISPRLHLHFHAIVERQLASDEPKGIVAIAEEMQQLGVSAHEVRHKIGTAIAEQIYRTTQKQLPFDEAGYMADLRKIVDSCR